MKKTRTEILIDLQQQLGHSEQTDHLIDWVLDLWETRDLLLKRFGWTYTMIILHPLEVRSPDLKYGDLIVDEALQEEMPNALLN